MMEKPVTTPPQFWPFPSNGIPQTFKNFNVVGLVHCGAFGKVGEMLHLWDKNRVFCNTSKTSHFL